jgi:hypothetical protein
LPGASCGRSEQARLALGCRKVQIVLTARTPLTERASTAASSRRDPGEDRPLQPHNAVFHLYTDVLEVRLLKDLLHFALDILAL